jgi:hypothetical protein
MACVSPVPVISVHPDEVRRGRVSAGEGGAVVGVLLLGQTVERSAFIEGALAVVGRIADVQEDRYAERVRGAGQVIDALPVGAVQAAGRVAAIAPRADVVPGVPVLVTAVDIKAAERRDVNARVPLRLLVAEICRDI